MTKETFALDLGTTKFCVAMPSQLKSASPQLDIVTTAAAGMKRGMLCDLKEAGEAVNRLIEQAEKRFNADIEKVAVGIAGTHLKGYHSSRTIDLESTTVSKDVLDQLESQIKRDHGNQHTQIIHVLPIHFHLADRREIENPIGLSGSKLTGDYFVVEADKYYLTDVVRLCNDCGLEVVQFMAEPFASSLVTAVESLRQLGVVVADIGGGTTDCMVHLGSRPSKIFTINVGGQLMTSDLSLGLGIAREEAEKLKTLWGLSYRGQGNRHIDISNAMGQNIRVSAADVFEILAPRALELGELILSGCGPSRSHLTAGIVLTGGSSQISGFSQFLNHELKINVQSIKPVISRSSHIDVSTRYATISGIVQNILDTDDNLQRETSFMSHYISPVMNWFRDLS